MKQEKLKWVIKCRWIWWWIIIILWGDIIILTCNSSTKINTIQIKISSIADMLMIIKLIWVTTANKVSLHAGIPLKIQKVADEACSYKFVRTKMSLMKKNQLHPNFWWEKTKSGSAQKCLPLGMHSASFLTFSNPVCNWSPRFYQGYLSKSFLKLSHSPTSEQNKWRLWHSWKHS